MFSYFVKITNRVKIIKFRNYFNNFLQVIIKARITINAAIPESPRLSNNATKFFVTCEPKNATSGPNNISANTETPIKSKPNSS